MLRVTLLVLGAMSIVAACNTGGAGGVTSSGAANPGGANATSGSASSGAADACPGGPTCFVDFPCEYAAVCLQDDPSTVLSLHDDTDCESACGTPCCRGAGCVGELVPCGDNSVCVATGYVQYKMDASCVPLGEACGGPDALNCPPGTFCDYGRLGDSTHTFSYPPCETFAAGLHGRCVPQPDPATCSPEGTSGSCGCDGVLYDNDCYRQAAGVVLQSLFGCY